MPTTWYFDGSGTSPECQVAVLSGLGAPDSVWRQFGQAWREGLQQLGLEAWHSTDYFRRRDNATRTDVPTVLLNVIGRQISQEFNAVSFAANKQAVAGVRAKHRGAVPPLERMLVDLCFSQLAVAKEDVGQQMRVRVFFDRDEPFIRHLKASWQNGRTACRRAREDGWPLQIREIEPASHTDHPGLEATDLISWAIRCRYEYGDKLVDPKVFTIMFPFMAAGRLRGGYLGAEEVEAVYVEERLPKLSHNYSFV